MPDNCRCFLVVFFPLLLDLVEIGEAYKLIRPYKYYQPRPWRRPRWYTGHKSSKFHHSNRIPPEDYYSGKPSYYRHGSTEGNLDRYAESHPYTIVIQLPKGDSKYGLDNYGDRKRNYERDTIPAYNNENDYIDDEDDFEAKTVKVNDKKVQIKMVKGQNPKLHIKISRSDNDPNIIIVDKLNATTTDLPLPQTVYANSALYIQESKENWTSASYLENV
ncbi:PREDICTED: uncharacterized protein LOC108573394 [Habropoda laboriosa]|uniref:uncharacterized protein LOC108573394 n=1 Tax=Habropoda laboriosa TaxID=597456 RepID=UPI00083D2350|nr:PREDICTED: uncharacterized protein LOC108573394 [Habropoda laboriosa]